MMPPRLTVFGLLLSHGAYPSPRMLTRRDFIHGSGALAGLAAVGGISYAEDPAGGSGGPGGQTFAQAIGTEKLQLLKGRLQAVNDDILAHGLRRMPGIKGTLLTGYPYNEFYDWDLYFENLYLSYYGVWPYCFTNLREFLDRQESDGYINRSLIKKRDRQHFKPFLAQLLVLGARQNGNDYEWVRGNYYDRLRKYIDKWFSYDSDKNGLPAWNSADAAGTDNQWSRAGALASFSVEGVDLASYLVRELRAMAVIADHLGRSGDAAAFNGHGDEVVRLIERTFWDEREGMYYDRNEKTGEAVRVKSATNFMPLFAGAAAPGRAKRLVNEHLLNENEFWVAYPVASYAKTEPDYYQGSHHECNWRGPTWAPTNYMIFHGLVRYGFKKTAETLASRLFDMALVKNTVLREYYNAETGEGLGQTRFWGFTALYYGMLLESRLGYDASSLTGDARPIFAQELSVSFPTPWPAATA
jgi:putative isomerase